MIDLEQLCWRLGTASLEQVRGNLESCLAGSVVRDQRKREPCWTESLAVGGVSFLEKVRPQIFLRRDTEIVETGKDVWALQESPIPYGQKAG